jgi:hypothetical protein
MLIMQASTAEPARVTITSPIDPTGTLPEFAVAASADPLGPIVHRTRDVLGNLTTEQILFFSAPMVGANSHTSPEWELGQPDASSNVDTSQTKGHWYPNVGAGGTPYVDADYSFLVDPDDGLSYLRSKITNGFTAQHAAQTWRRYDWAASPGNFGSDLPAHAYYSWWIRHPQQLYYLNSSGSTFGFTNCIQWYSLAGSTTGPFLAMGPGTNPSHETAYRWHFDMADAAQFDLTQVNDQAIPLNEWIFMEAEVRVSSGSDGRWVVWGGSPGEPAVKILDFAGATVGAGSTKFGVSWGMYGTLLTPTTALMDYRDILISTVPIRPYLATGAGWATGSWSGGWDSTTGKAVALTPMIGAGQPLDVMRGNDYRLSARWHAGAAVPVHTAEILRIV